MIENLDGGPWWSYVSHEFAEILTALKQIGIRSNVKYRTFTQPTDFNSEVNLSKYILNACDLDEQSYKQNPVPIIILIWDVNLVLWHEVSEYWQSVFETFKVRLVALIGDLH